MPPDSESILITGATGYLGGLAVATALTRGHERLVLPLRDPTAWDTVVGRVAAELEAGGRPLTPEDRERMIPVTLPPTDRLGELLPVLREHRVRDVLHCAGCLSYFNVRQLQEGNIDLTREFVRLSQDLDVRRFLFVSTAYSSGFTDEIIPEALHESPGADPTDYTRTKREAEQVVAGSGLSYVIVRPSIVIGDDRDGRYSGKAYGVYQLWHAYDRFVAKTNPTIVHLVASDAPINFLHQNAFTNALWAAYRELPDDTIVHVVSRDEGLPSLRGSWERVLTQYGSIEEVHFYPSLDRVPTKDMSRRMRFWNEFTSINMEIGSAHWRFDTRVLDGLRHAGLSFADCTYETFATCQERYFRDYPKAFAARLPDAAPLRFVVHD